MLNRIKNNTMFSSGLEILHEIESHGFQALFVGGCVRDLLLKKESHDIDICTNAPMELLEKLFSNFDIGKNKSFGIVVVKKNGFDFEVAQKSRKSIHLGLFVFFIGLIITNSTIL